MAALFQHIIGFPWYQNGTHTQMPGPNICIQEWTLDGVSDAIMAFNYHH